METLLFAQDEQISSQKLNMMFNQMRTMVTGAVAHNNRLRNKNNMITAFLDSMVSNEYTSLLPTDALSDYNAMVWTAHDTPVAFSKVETTGKTYHLSTQSKKNKIVLVDNAYGEKIPQNVKYYEGESTPTLVTDPCTMLPMILSPNEIWCQDKGTITHEVTIKIPTVMNTRLNFIQLNTLPINGLTSTLILKKLDGNNGLNESGITSPLTKIVDIPTFSGEINLNMANNNGDYGVRSLILNEYKFDETEGYLLYKVGGMAGKTIKRLLFKGDKGDLSTLGDAFRIRLYSETSASITTVDGLGTTIFDTDDITLANDNVISITSDNANLYVLVDLKGDSNNSYVSPTFEGVAVHY